jgi:Glyoxalase/Bleomycin resistance protein/Dioxygenase superfamily
MFARPNAHHSQVAYVTNDLNGAIALFEREYDTPGFFVFSNVPPEVENPEGPVLKIALASVGGVEIELIEPVGLTAPLFSDPLAGFEGLAVAFHHVAIRIEGPLANWDRHVASIDLGKHKIVFEGAMGDDLRYFYTDERSALGHCVEHVWMSPAILEQMAAAVPRY